MHARCWRRGGKEAGAHCRTVYPVRQGEAAALSEGPAGAGRLENPLIGEMKSGALKGVRVVKFKLGPLELLLAYEFNDRRNAVELLDVGPHENFYRDLEAYQKDR